jgi:Enoyl-(Acyl carrier protein) reductase
VARATSISVAQPPHASRLRSSAARVWVHASTFAGVNRALWPLARMTFLPALEKLAPGPVRTAMNDRRVADDAQRRGVSFAEQEASLTPAGRRLEPEEIAPLAVYLASDEARRVTGQAFNICGGLVMS